MKSQIRRILTFDIDFFCCQAALLKSQITIKYTEESAPLSFVFQYKHLNETCYTCTKSPREIQSTTLNCRKTPFYVVLATIMYLCHRYWTCTASEARYVFFFLVIVSSLKGLLIKEQDLYFFCDHFPVVSRR